MDMFDLPYGMPVDDEIDVSDGSILPFENGSVTTYLGRRSTASGIAYSRWTCCRMDSRACKRQSSPLWKGCKDRLETLEMEQHRLIAKVWTQSALGSVAEVIPEAFEHAADMRGLIGAGDSLERLLSRDLSAYYHS